jgi:N-acetylmuramoyl-L-alanine amidase
MSIFRAVTRLQDSPVEQPVLYLDLHYLITYWDAAEGAEAEQKILAGRCNRKRPGGSKMSSTGSVPFFATGQDVVQLAQRHVGEKYALGILVPKDNASWTGPWDCAEFASWLIFQTAKSLYGCDRDYGDPSTADAYTGYWERDSKTLGQIISVDQAARTPGAAVLRTPQPGATGHIIISDGLGGTVEAHSSKDGVIQSKIADRRWDFAIQISGIAYTQGPSVTVVGPTTEIYRLTTPLLAGNKIQEIQQALRAACFDPGVIDGEFGPHTHAAVVAFQVVSGLIADGEVGPKTATSLGIQL